MLGEEEDDRRNDVGVCYAVGLDEGAKALNGKLRHDDGGHTDIDGGMKDAGEA